MTQHTQWNSSLYLKFAAERTQPARDLVRRIELESPTRIVDLGCGPGNSTDVLFQRWPQAEILGIDNSAEMIQAAQSNHPQRHWIVADMNSWGASEPQSLVFSNAAIQWLGHHEEHLARCKMEREAGPCSKVSDNAFARILLRRAGAVFPPSRTLGNRLLSCSTQPFSDH